LGFFEEIFSKRESEAMMNVSTTSTWFQYRQHRPQAQIRLFCFPYAGGGASIFHSWSRQALPEIDICPVQLPGRENRLLDKPFSDIHFLISALASALLPYLDRPFAFFGHSMGALISFELARYLRHMGYGLEPLHLFVSGHRAPQLPDTDPPTYHLSRQAFVEELRRLKGTPEEVLQNEELLELLLPCLRADFALCQKYIYKDDKPLDASITAFGGLRDNMVPHDTVAAWQAQTSKVFKLQFFEGDHFFLHDEHFSLLQSIYQEIFMNDNRSGPSPN
jgi:medium-chain acyl-[acyl-carrier-protein] hydrolase